MKYSGNLSSSTPVIKKYKASAALAAGIVGVRHVANASGQVSTSTTTTATDSYGLVLDNGEKFGAVTTYSTTQGAVEGVVSVIVNPDQILRAQMVTGATGTSITQDTVVTAVTNGLTVVGGTSVASPDMDEGLIWFTSGGNLSESRKITSTSSVTATVLVPFPRTSAVGDTYLYAGLNIGLTGVTLTTDLKNVRADIAVSTGASLTPIEFDLAGANDSYVYLMLGDCVWNNAT
ncbi:MAG: hypothetical protein ABL983_00940 [Nitrospira sp.]